MKLFNKSNKQPLGDGTCIFINEVGAPQERVFRILSENGDKMIIGFSAKEQYEVAKSSIRAKRMIMFKTASGKIIVQNPNDWAKVDLEGQGIKELRFNLQNFGLQESKAAQHRWTLPLTKMQQLIPLFKLLFICIAVGVIGWSAFKFGTYLFDKVSASNLIDCATIIPRAPVPIGVNVTAPIGA